MQYTQNGPKSESGTMDTSHPQLMGSAVGEERTGIMALGC